MAAAQMSPLLDLPAEIRTLIYGLVVARPNKIVVRGPYCATPALAQTCRQMREEVIPIWLENNTFTILTATEIHKWMPINSTTLSLINSIALDVESSVMWYQTLKHYDIQPTRISTFDDDTKVSDIVVIWASHAKILASLAENPRMGAFKAISELTKLLNDRQRFDGCRKIAEEMGFAKPLWSSAQKVAWE